MKKLYILNFILAAILGCASKRPEPSLSFEALSLNSKCLQESKTILVDAGFYKSNFKNASDMINWAKNNSNDVFHKQIAILRNNLPKNLDLNNYANRALISKEFIYRFRPFFSENCRDYSLLYFRSEFERVASINFNFDPYVDLSSNIFYYDIIYGKSSKN